MLNCADVNDMQTDMYSLISCNVNKYVLSSCLDILIFPSPVNHHRLTAPLCLTSFPRPLPENILLLFEDSAYPFPSKLSLSNLNPNQVKHFQLCVPTGLNNMYITLDYNGYLKIWLHFLKKANVVFICITPMSHIVLYAL